MIEKITMFSSIVNVIISVILIATVFAQPCSPCTDTVYVGYGGGADHRNYESFTVSKDGGKTWTKRDLNQLEYRSISTIAAAGENVYVGTNLMLHISNDGGQTWREADPDPGEGMRDIHNVFADQDRVYLAMKKFYESNRFIVSNDKGATWPIKVPFEGDDYFEMSAVYASDGKSYVGMDGRGRRGLEVSEDDGKTWKLISTDNVKAIAGAAGKLYIGLDGDGARVSISEDQGKTWKTQNTTPLGLKNEVTSIVATGDKVYVSSLGGGVSISSDGGKTWLNKMVSDGLADNKVNSLAVSGNNVYATARDGLSISNDGGNTWTKVKIGLRKESDKNKDVVAVFAQCL